MYLKEFFSNECIDLIKNSCDIVLRGNCDEYFTSKHDLTQVDEIEKQRIIKYDKQISVENKEYLRGLPYCYEFYLSGRLVRLFHAGPDSIYNYTNVGAWASIDEKYQMFEPNSLTISDNIADIVIYGHIHIQ